MGWPSAMRSTFTAADDLLRGEARPPPAYGHQRFIFRPRTSRRPVLLHRRSYRKRHGSGTESKRNHIEDK